MININKRLLFSFILVLILTISIAAAVLTIKTSSVVRITDAPKEEKQQIPSKINIRASSVIISSAQEQENQLPITNKAMKKTSSVIKRAEENPRTAEEVPITPTPELATIVNGRSIDDDPYIKAEYLPHYNYFADVEFKALSERTAFTLKTGNVEEKIEGLILNGKKYAFHLVGCHREEQTCTFRVNGMPLSDLHEGDSVALDQEYTMKVKAIAIDWCDDREICDYKYWKYDKVDLEVGKDAS